MASLFPVRRFRGVCFVPIILFLLATPELRAGSPMLNRTADLTWHFRVLIVSGAHPDAHQAELEGAADAIGERDLLWFLLRPDAVVSNHPGPLAPAFVREMRSALESAPGAVVMIGKDGQTKMATEDLDLPAVFARIDAMPMRRREMGREAFR